MRSTSYPLRPKHSSKRPVVSVSEALRASTSKVSLGDMSYSDIHASGVSNVDANVSGLLDDETLSTAPSQLSQPLPAKHLPYVDGGSKLHPNKPIVSGFDRMNASIMNLVERLPDTTLDDKFDTVSKWIESFHVDVVPHKVARELELIINIANEHARDFGGPSTTKAISSAFALTQLLQLTTRIRPVLGPICAKVTDGVLESIFLRTPATYSRELIDVSLPREELLRQLSHFRGKMFFQEARDTTKKLDSVQRFMILNSEIRENQKRVLGQALAHWHSHSKGFVFRSWRAAILQRKLETKHREEVAKLRVDVSMLEDKLHAMRAQLADRDETIVSLKADAASEAEEQETVQMALKYDVMKLTDHNAVLQQELDARTAAFDEEKQRIMHLGEESRTTLRRMTQELRVFRANVFDSTCRTAQQQSAVTAVDTNRQVTDKSLLKWMRGVLASLQEETPTYYDDLHRNFGVKVAADVVAPVRLRAGGDLLSSIAVCLRALYPNALNDELLSAQFLQQSTAEKAIALLRFYGQCGLPVPSCITDDMLVTSSEDGDASCKILLCVLVQACANPQSLRPDSVVLPDPFPGELCNEMEALKGSVHGFRKWSETAAAACQFVYSACMSISQRNAGGAASSLTQAEVADQSHYALTPHSLSCIGVGGDAVDALQAVARKYLPLLRNVFRHYDGTKDPASSAQLSEERFVSFARDIRVAKSGEVDKAVVSGVCHTVGPLSPRQFVVALISLATIRYPQGSAVESFRTLLEQNVKPFAERTDFTFVQQVLRESGSVAPVLDEVRNDLFKLFRRYCNHAPNKMTLSDFRVLMKETNTSECEDNGALSEEETSLAFTAALAQPLDDGITFDTFVQLCTTVALMRLRQPWISPELRAKRYLLHWLIEPLKKKAGLQYVNPI